LMSMSLKKLLVPKEDKSQQDGGLDKGPAIFSQRNIKFDWNKNCKGYWERNMYEPGWFEEGQRLEVFWNFAPMWMGIMGRLHKRYKTGLTEPSVPCAKKIKKQYKINDATEKAYFFKDSGESWYPEGEYPVDIQSALEIFLHSSWSGYPLGKTSYPYGPPHKQDYKKEWGYPIDNVSLNSTSIIIWKSEDDEGSDPIEFSWI